jgi:hypothetical protein
MKSKRKIKVGDWVKYREGGPMLSNEVIGEVVLVAGYIDLLVAGRAVTIHSADVLEVRAP